MLCPKCKEKFKQMGHPVYKMMTRACYAFKQEGYVYYDIRNDMYGECLRFLENKGYLFSTEISEYEIAYKINYKTAWYIDPGFYCWCYLHYELEENDKFR